MLRGTDAPGVYAAFPWGGYARKKGATGTRSNVIGARALYFPLSPPHLLRLVRLFGHGGDSPSSTQYTDIKTWQHGKGGVRGWVRGHGGVGLWEADPGCACCEDYD